MRLIIFLLTWILAGLIVAWCTHSRTIEGERDVNPKQEENGQ